MKTLVIGCFIAASILIAVALGATGWQIAWQSLIVAIVIAAVLYGLALNDVLFAIVPQGKAKVVTRFGEYTKTLWVFGGWVSDGKTIVRKDECYTDDTLTKKVDGNPTGKTVYYKRRQMQVLPGATVPTKWAKDDEGNDDVNRPDVASSKPLDQVFLDQNYNVIERGGSDKSLADIIAKMDVGGQYVEKTAPPSVPYPYDFFNLVGQGYYYKDGAGNHIPVHANKSFKRRILDVPVKLNVKECDRSDRQIFGGLFLVGIPFVDWVHSYHFRWTSLIGDSNSKDGVRTETRDEIIRHVNLSDDVYVVQIADAEDKTSLPLDIQLMMKIRIVNPYLALFAIEKWMENVTTVAGSKYRKLVAGYKFEQIASEFTSLGDDWWTEFLWHIANSRGEDLERRYGVRILVSEIWKVDPATAEGRDPEIFNAQRTIFIAEKDARKTVIDAEANRKKLEKTGIGEGQQIAEKAKGEAEATRTKMAAEADRIKLVFGTITSFGDEGQKIQFMETLREMGNKEGKTVVIPIGDMSRFLNGTLGIEQQSKLFNDLASKGITADMIAQAIRNLKNPPRGGRRGH